MLELISSLVVKPPIVIVILVLILQYVYYSCLKYGNKIISEENIQIILSNRCNAILI